MATSLSTSASTLAKPTPNCPRSSPFRLSHAPRSLSFRLAAPKPKLRFLSKGLVRTSKALTVVKAQSKEVALDGSSNAAAMPPSKPSVPASESKEIEPSPASIATDESISEFVSQVANLVKLVDSRDIVELQLKQLDCELIIRKKEALPQPPAPAPPMMVQAPSHAIVSPAPVAPAAAAAPAPPAAPSPPTPSASKAAESSLPALKCPMAGTFYRSPGPSEPPFVKKGDKVQKGQVLCIIEAMKLMNEIEADQSGTIVDVLVEDGKPVSVDTPLFIIQP